ncbi:UDP-glucose 4-epimerase GalE [Sphingomonas melonis]|uniref:UDP-glucose 4-epimerase GalE n=1 Tax=Sphingomonas melonis TaxID=152682 RepID=UPI001C8BD3B8|nr:UDP-glucose 4-epimerase GalE [Sphingomonas melonis]MBX8846654.1 UDP-glucose 4-epimerase GalE [Sphingomonas melonis]MBX8855757.1 UDP-glucose 4-epimerase GalE [Sphingomonas melonis]MBX8900753.1 UDP-glucose 4-epimerase GalE [Sphingomonas melonis]
MAFEGKVMVTGGAGYIGSHAVLALCDAGYDVVVVDNLVTGFAWAVDPRATLVEANVADDIAVRAAIRDHNVRAIMHFAGSVVVPESVSDPLKYYRNNTAATRSLIESAVTEGVPHFIFSSTAATYGTPVRVPVEETDPTVPINPYGMSKLMSEAMLRDVAAAHPINYCALRYFNVAGADPQGRSGQSTVGATHLIKIAVEAATGKREAVSVFGTDFDTPDGTGVRDYIHVSDLAAAHVAALDLLVAEPTKSHTLNAGYNRGFSVNEVLDAVDRVTNMTIARRYEGRRAGDPAALVADNRAILAALPWRPQRDDLDGIVRDALAWERRLSERA